MAPLQARLMVLAILGLSTAISVNALYFQQATIPSARKYTDRVPQDIKPNAPKRAVKKRAPQWRKPSSAKTLEQPTHSISSGLVKSIQVQLSAKNYLPGVADGIAGVSTRAAIMAFEFDNGLPVRAEPSEEIFKQILFGPSSGRDVKSSGEVSGEAAIKITRAVQKVLADLGYAPGPVDGYMGKETRKAIKDFEKDRRLPVKGRISGRLIAEIKKVADFELTI